MRSITTISYGAEGEWRKSRAATDTESKCYAVYGERDRPLCWTCLIFHHSPKLKMWTVITYLPNCLSSKGGCHIGFLEVKGVKQRTGTEWINDCWSHQMPHKTALFKRHLLQMHFLDCFTKWGWPGLKWNIWKGFGRLIPHTFMVQYSRYINKIYHSM